jgi:hypothetical protein
MNIFGRFLLNASGHTGADQLFSALVIIGVPESNLQRSSTSKIKIF